MHTIDYVEIGRKIRQARIELGLSQEKLAEQCSISTSFLGHIERGTRKMSLETMIALCSVLHISTDYLLMDELPDSDTVLTSLLESVKKSGTVQYQKYIYIIKVLAKIANEL